MVYSSVMKKISYLFKIKTLGVSHTSMMNFSDTPIKTDNKLINTKKIKTNDLQTNKNYYSLCSATAV